MTHAEEAKATVICRGFGDKHFRCDFLNHSTLQEMAERPKDLTYTRDENPPAIPLIAVGFQHVAVICRIWLWSR